MNTAGEYDAIVMGTGAGGGTLALHLAQAGKNILILERGPFMPQEKLNWDTSVVFLDNRYHTKETCQDKDGVVNAQPGVGGAHPAGDTGRINETEQVSDSALPMLCGVADHLLAERRR